MKKETYKENNFISTKEKNILKKIFWFSFVMMIIYYLLWFNIDSNFGFELTVITILQALIIIVLGIIYFLKSVFAILSKNLKNFLLSLGVLSSVFFYFTLLLFPFIFSEIQIGNFEYASVLAVIILLFTSVFLTKRLIRD